MPRKYPSSMILELDSGGTFGPLLRPLGDGETLIIKSLAALPPRNFGICPICRAATATEKEDLPPQALVGVS